MKINIKARLKNKVFLATIIPLIITFVYQVLGLFDVVPKVSEDSIINGVSVFINILATLGVLVDPTTKGLSDSERAMTYYTENDVREDV
jgi:phi LC3 family holin